MGRDQVLFAKVGGCATVPGAGKCLLAAVPSCNTDTNGLAGTNVTDMICHIDYRTCMHACRLAHDIASFLIMGARFKRCAYLVLRIKQE